MSEPGAVEAEIMAMEDAGTLDGGVGDEADEVDALDAMQGMMELDPRLSRISVGASPNVSSSLASLTVRPNHPVACVRAMISFERFRSRTPS